MDIRTHGNAGHLAALVPPTKHARQWQHFWSSPEAFADFVSSIKQDDCWNDSGYSKERSDDSWRGTKDMQEAIAYARAGWPDGAERANKLRDRINAKNPTGPRMVRYGVAGAYPNVARALAGNPMHMRSMDNANLRRRPVITLVSDFANHCGVDSTVILRRSAVVAAIVDAIEAKGYSCHVVSTFRSASDDLTAALTIELKAPGTPVDIGRLAFGLGHPSLLRRLCFSGVLGCDGFTKDLGPGLGTPKHLKHTPDMAARMVFVLPAAQHVEAKFNSDDKAETEGLAYLIAELSKQGCPAFPTAED